MQGASRASLARLRETLAEQTADADGSVLRQLSEDLFAVVTLLASQGSLRRTISDPGIEADGKVSIVDSLLGERLTAPALELVRAIARARWSAPGDVVDAAEALAVEAALQRAETDGVLDEVEDELFRFERIIDGGPELRAALTDRNLPADRKGQLVHRLLDGKVADVSLALIERAVLAPRGRTVERVLEEFTELAAKRRERLIARVTSAVALSEEQQESLVAALAREFSRDIRLQLVVDPDIVGGLTVRIGDELIDGSVLRHLDAARRYLTGGSGLRT
ncbi:MAG: F-type H+-transporting ATPase subunit delta [Frankiaceae bacterium]|jgi:F-type H+-transporting ATPase subunit delta|nr:F-type H+-transporting ATPase subunit delta [Frankiaceae bacterium]